MSVTDEPAVLDATAQAQRVHRREVKPLELVEAAIERIERVNPRLDAVVTPMYDEARRRALGPSRRERRGPASAAREAR